MILRSVRHVRYRRWLVLLMLCLGGTVAWGDLASLDRPADSDAMLENVEKLSRQIATQPDSAALYVQRAEAYFKLRELDKSIEDYNTALRLDDRQDDAYFGRGMAYGRHGDIDRGIADLGVYLQRHPQSSLAHTKRGIRYLWKGDLANAEKDLARAIQLDPRNAEAHDDLGVIFAQRGDYQRAQEHFSATIRHDPSYQKAYHNLAMVYYLTDRETQALAAANEAVRLAPEDRNALLLKSRILEALGRHDEAQRVRDEADFLPAGNWSERMNVQ